MSDGAAMGPSEDLGMFGVKGGPKHQNDKGSAQTGGADNPPIAEGMGIDASLREVGGLHSKSKISSVRTHEEKTDIPMSGEANGANERS